MAKYNARDYRGAVQYAEAAVQGDPTHWQAWQLDGNARYALGDKKGALTVYKYSLQVNPNNPQLKGFVARLESELGVTPASAPQAAAATISDFSEEGKKYSVGLWGGYTTIGMKEVNADGQRLLDDAKAQAALGGTTLSEEELTEFSSGIIFGVEGGYVVSERLSYGVRIGYLSAGEAKVSYTWNQFIDFGGGNTFSQTATQTNVISATVIPVFVGGRYTSVVNEKLSLNGGLFVGMGLAKAELTYESSDVRVGTGILAFSTQTIAAAGKLPMNGSGFGGEVLVGALYQITPSISFGLDLGYRMLNVSKMTATADADFDGDGVVDAKEGDSLVDDKDEPIPFDFSGTIGAVRVVMSL